MKKIIFATNNLHKLQEAYKILKNNINVLSLNDIKFNSDIPEDYQTLKENASQKSWFVYNKTFYDCFSDDTGLEVEALGGKPGVYSARYAGEKASYSDNVNKILDEMVSIENRKARFRTVISLILNGKEYFFEGIVNGFITKNIRGNNGFGYDPIFVPEGYDKTFAELNEDVKNKLSHRAIALKKMADFLSLNIY